MSPGNRRVLGIHPRGAWSGSGRNEARGGRLQTRAEEQGRCGRNPFKQQGLAGSNTQIRMETFLHHAVVESVINRQQTHSLMMSHVGINNNAPLAFWTTLASVVQCFIKTFSALHAHLA